MLDFWKAISIKSTHILFLKKYFVTKFLLALISKGVLETLCVPTILTFKNFRIWSFFTMSIPGALFMSRDYLHYFAISEYFKPVTVETMLKHNLNLFGFEFLIFFRKNNYSKIFCLFVPQSKRLDCRNTWNCLFCSWPALLHIYSWNTVLSLLIEMCQ